jgi:hypothetical protein
MQLEIASSTGLGDKDRYLIGGTTLATTLTTGWNLVSRRLSYDNYYLRLIETLKIRNFFIFYK